MLLLRTFNLFKFLGFFFLGTNITRKVIYRIRTRTTKLWCEKQDIWTNGGCIYILHNAYFESYTVHFFKVYDSNICVLLIIVCIFIIYMNFFVGYLFKPYTSRNWCQSYIERKSLWISWAFIWKRGFWTHACSHPVRENCIMLTKKPSNLISFFKIHSFVMGL